MDSLEDRLLWLEPAVSRKVAATIRYLLDSRNAQSESPHRECLCLLNACAVFNPVGKNRPSLEFRVCPVSQFCYRIVLLTMYCHLAKLIARGLYPDRQRYSL